MAAVLTSIKITNNRQQDQKGPFDLSPSNSSYPAEANLSSRADGKLILYSLCSSHSPASTPSGKRTLSKLSRNNTSGPKDADAGSTARSTSTTAAQSNANAVAAANASSTIDPLSQHIFLRTNTDPSKPIRLRSPPIRSDSPPGDGLPRQSSDLSTKHSTPTGDAAKDRRKGSSFLSRLSMRGSKKKDDDFDDDESELSELRTDGTHAPVFSSIVGAGGYIPHHKEPPKYIRIKAYNKKEKEFNRMFLAQELVGTKPLAAEADEKAPRVTVTTAGAGRRRTTETGGAIWTTEFSRDGKYLAAAGRDKVVRVWAVISTREDRRAYEEEEAAISNSSGGGGGTAGTGERLSAPVFLESPVREFEGHTGEVLDLSWSKNNFLLSTSMDKTVRLWHVSRKECLCTFKHKELVSKVAFHPTDDRFFLAGCLDMTLRLWSIPDKYIAYSAHLPDLITAVAFSPDGKTAIAGLLSGLCHFFDTDGLKPQAQVHVRSSRGKNAKGSKITGIQTMVPPEPADPSDVKVLITSTDSRIRIYNLRDKSLDVKFKGHEHACSQLSASFSDDAKYVICGSEDRKAFIWGRGAAAGPPESGGGKDKTPCECFDAHGDIVTTAVFAPTRTRQLLGASGDPIYDLCNPPPVTLVSMRESTTASQTALSEDQQSDVQAAGAAAKKPEESPAYIARSTHYDGNIIVTTDDRGVIKVFRQDCAFLKRKHECWETGSAFSKKLGSTGLVGRSASILTRTSASSAAHSRRGSISQVTSAGGVGVGQSSGPNSAVGTPQLGSSDRILSWRQGIESNSRASVSSTPARSERSLSPGKTQRTPLSSAANLASEARKLPYVGSSPVTPQFNHAQIKSGPASPTSSTFGMARAAAAAAAARKERDGGGADEQPMSPPTPSFTFRPVDGDDDQMRLDPAGASYGFWNLNKWKGIANLRGSISSSSGGGGGGGGDAGSTATSSPAAGADKEKTAGRRSFPASILPKSPLQKTEAAPTTTTTTTMTTAADEADGPAASQQQQRRAGRSSLGHSISINTNVGGGDQLVPPPERSPYGGGGSVVSRLSSELSSGDEGAGEEMQCPKCGGMNFKLRRVGGRQKLVCGRCGKPVDEDSGVQM